MDYWLQMQGRSETTQNVVEEYHNLTKLNGHKTTSDNILELARHTGIVYQRKGKEGTSISQNKFPKVTTPTQNPITNLNVDIGSWIANSKVLV
jgi:hypothetical protein